jgi:hypothetical protein
LLLVINYLSLVLFLSPAVFAVLTFCEAFLLSVDVAKEIFHHSYQRTLAGKQDNNQLLPALAKTVSG